MVASFGGKIQGLLSAVSSRPIPVMFYRVMLAYLMFLASYKNCWQHRITINNCSNTASLGSVESGIFKLLHNEHCPCPVNRTLNIYIYLRKCDIWQFFSAISLLSICWTFCFSAAVLSVLLFITYHLLLPQVLVATVSLLDLKIFRSW